MAEAVRVEGLAELVNALTKADKKLSKEFRDELRVAGTIVKSAAATDLAEKSPKSAGGLRSRFRREGVVTVEQNLRKVTGKRPDWGVLQQKLLEEKLEEHHAEVEARLEFAVDVALRELL